MTDSTLRTSEIARAAGIHPNTVRVYEEWGFLPPIPRASNGYRQFSPLHLSQVLLVRRALQVTWLGGPLRRTAQAVIFQGAAGEYQSAHHTALELQQMIQSEQQRAEAAAALLQQWAENQAAVPSAPPLHISSAARHLDVTIDSLRNWERNGLLSVPRHPGNNYRLYGLPELQRLLVIRTLRAARYSTMSILRMLTRLDQGQRSSLRTVLDTPTPEEDAIYATDRWLTTLTRVEKHVDALVDLTAQIAAAVQDDDLMLNLSGDPPDSIFDPHNM
jgi:DNA-binding transcriptional MerR regulator